MHRPAGCGCAGTSSRRTRSRRSPGWSAASASTSRSRRPDGLSAPRVPRAAMHGMVEAMATTRPAPEVTSYLRDLEPARRRTDAEALIELMGRVTGERAEMWGPSIVGFGTYHYRYESGR